MAMIERAGQKKENAMPDPEVQTSTEFEIEQFLRDYENPRGLSKKWLEGYLSRPKPRLAIDVIRVFDGHFKFERELRRTRLILGVVNGLLLVVTVIFTLVHLLR